METLVEFADSQTEQLAYVTKLNADLGELEQKVLSQEALLNEQAAHISKIEAENKRLRDKLGERFLLFDPLEEIPTEPTYVLDAPDGGITLDYDPLRVTPSLLTYLEKGQTNPQGKAKAEFGPRFGEQLKRYGRIPFGVERWHAVTVSIPPSWEYDGNKTSIIDFHGTEDPSEIGIGRNASLSVMIGNRRLYGWRLWSDNPDQTGNENRVVTFEQAIPTTGGIFRVVFRTVFDWKPNGKGETDIWLDFGQGLVQKFSERGPNAYNDAEGPYFKIGVYAPAWNRGDTTPSGSKPKRLWWYDLRIAGPGALLSDMA